MDADHFDALSRSLSTAGSRRRALGGLLTGVFGLLGGHGQEEAAAHDLKDPCKKKSGEAKKTCLKKAKKHKAAHASEPPPPPPPPPGGTCGVDQKPCNGACIPADRCCTSVDCAPGRSCQYGACTCDEDFECPAKEFCQLDAHLCMPCRGTGESCDVGGGGTSSHACCSNHCVGVGSVNTCRDNCRAHGECPSGKCCFSILSPGPGYCALTSTEECLPG
jgi:hypothetical protein